MKKQVCTSRQVFDFLQIAFAYYKQTATTSKYYFYYACLTQLPHGWQASGEKPYIRCSKVLKIY